MPANYEDDDQPMAGEESGSVTEDSSRAHGCRRHALTCATLTRCWPGSATMACGEASHSTNGTLSGVYPKNDNYVGRMLTEIVTTGQGAKIMECVRLLLKAQATRIFRDAGLAAELVGRQLRNLRSRARSSELMIRDHMPGARHVIRGGDRHSRKPGDLHMTRNDAARPPENHVIVLFGATGDLARRKLLPGLFHLHAAGLLPRQYHVIWSGRHPSR